MKGESSPKLQQNHLVWNDILSSLEDQMGARSQIENETYLLSYKDMPLMGREKSHIKETKETNKKLRISQRKSTSIS